MAREARLSHDWCHLKEYFKLRKWHQNHQNLVRFRTVPEARVLGIQEDTLWMIHSTLPDIIWTEARSYGTFRLHFWMMGIICFNNIHFTLNACFRFFRFGATPHFRLAEQSVTAWPLPLLTYMTSFQEQSGALSLLPRVCKYSRISFHLLFSSFSAQFLLTLLLSIYKSDCNSTYAC